MIRNIPQSRCLTYLRATRTELSSCPVVMVTSTMIGRKWNQKKTGFISEEKVGKVRTPQQPRRLSNTAAHLDLSAAIKYKLTRELRERRLHQRHRCVHHDSSPQSVRRIHVYVRRISAQCGPDASGPPAPARMQTTAQSHPRARTHAARAQTRTHEAAGWEPQCVTNHALSLVTGLRRDVISALRSDLDPKREIRILTLFKTRKRVP